MAAVGIKKRLSVRLRNDAGEARSLVSADVNIMTRCSSSSTPLSMCSRVITWPLAMGIFSRAGWSSTSFFLKTLSLYEYQFRMQFRQT